MQCLQHPVPVYTGKCATRSLHKSNGRCALLLDGLFWAFRGLPDVTVAGLPLPEDGHPLFGVWSAMFTRMREDASCAWNCLLVIVSLLDILREDDGVPEDVHVPATGFDGELIFGCKWVQQIHISHVLVAGTNNVRPLNFTVGSAGFVLALNPLHRSGLAKDNTSVMTAQMLWFPSTLTSSLPLTFFYKLFSSLRSQLGRCTCLAIPT